MDLIPSEEQREITTSVRDYLADAFPAPATREPLPDDAEARSWSGLAELGIFGLGIAEEHGGVGLGLAEELLVFEEFGRALTPGPLLGTVLGAHAAVNAGMTDLAEEIIGGAARVAIAEPRREPIASIGETISGEFRIFDGQHADWVLFVSPDRAALVRASALELQPSAATDPVSSAAHITVRDLAAEAVIDGAPLWWRGTVLVAAMLTGIAQATRDISAEYVKVREQFGKPIGQFQAVKHRCADMATRAEAAHFQTVYAALSSEDAPDVLQIASALFVAAQAAQQNADDNIVNHGGMGFSAETGVDMFGRRAAVLDTMLGTPRWHLEELAAIESAQW